LIPYSENGACFSTAGRPFRDGDGRLRSSNALIAGGDDGTNPLQQHWSKGVRDLERAYAIDDKNSNKVRASVWTRRALGEHASIASFAAFTIALMSNAAPPSLIRQALSAAQDELRHAEVSFEVASLLTGTTVEPSPLPPSELRFDRNMTALVLGAAREGCVDETLSALLVAAEVDSDLKQTDLHGFSRPLAERSKTIALEEARHSALAWLTVNWVCSTDEEACEIVKKQVLNRERLSDIRVGSLEAQQGWTCIWETLLPRVPAITKKVDPAIGDASSFPSHCCGHTENGAVCAVVMRIISIVVDREGKVETTENS